MYTFKPQLIQNTLDYLLLTQSHVWPYGVKRHDDVNDELEKMEGIRGSSSFAL
jgi:hypothetical protein